MQGLNDISIDKKNNSSLIDEKIYGVLADFIRTCDMPMTIALQGEWGSGKSSFMNLVKETLGDSVYYDELDVWPISLFDFKDKLPIIILDTLYKKFGYKEKLVNDLTKKALKVGSSILSDKVIGIDIYNSLVENSNLSELHSLQLKFQECVNKKIESIKPKNNKCDRAVIFIDNLDRIEPKKAFEIIEILKAFMDCNNCVFVLAVDYDVIKKGAEDKYDKEKGSAFFDKIIQLPFNMPIEYYKINGYIEKLLEKAFADRDIDIIKDDLKEIIKYIIGPNPRAIKRAINVFLIVDKLDYAGIQDTGDEESMKLKVPLFCLSCIKAKSYKLFKLLYDNLDYINQDNDIKRYIEFCNNTENFVEFIADKKALYQQNFENIMSLYTKAIEYCFNTEKIRVTDIYNAIKQEHLSIFCNSNT